MKTVQEVIDSVDSQKANVFDNATKTGWLNEIEGRIKVDVLGASLGEITPLVYSYVFEGAGISFPDAATMLLPSASKFRAGDLVAITGLTDYANNNISATIVSVGDDKMTVTFAEDTFTDTGEAGDSGEASISYDGKDVELVVPSSYDNLYGLYLMAMIDFANGEYSKYNNTLLMFDSAMSDYKKYCLRSADRPEIGGFINNVVG